MAIGSGSPQHFAGTGMAQVNDVRASIKVCMFDQYGTVVDMQTGLIDRSPFPGVRAGRSRDCPKST